ncbi:hypothetical protein BOTU111921_13650 [Bordetella tumbae]
MIESKPNSLSDASRSKRSRGIFKCVAIKPVSARSNCPAKASPEGIVPTLARASPALPACTDTVCSCTGTAFVCVDDVFS